MPEDQQYLLNNTPTTSHRVTLRDGQALLTQETRFELSPADIGPLVFFLKQVKLDKTIRHTFTDENYVFEYDPARSELEVYTIRKRTTGRVISMGYSTAGRLLNALTGKTERLVKE